MEEQLMIDFLILYEHKAREIENDCLLKYELEKRGYSVEILNLHDLKRTRYLFYRKPRVVLTSALYDDEDFHYHVNTIVGKTSKIVNLQWEQVLSKKWLKIGFHNPKGKATYASHICWGDESYERLKNVGVKNPIITGAIQMDFLREKFKSYYHTKDEIKSQFNIKSEKILLYISSFALANESEEFLSTFSKRIETDVNDMRRLMYISKKETLKWMEDLLNTIEDITIVYRPHPSELVDKSLLKLEQTYENFKVINEYSVKQWILISDKVFTWISTSIVEAYFAHKKCGILRPVKVDEEMEAVIYKDSQIITSYDEFLSEAISTTNSKFPIVVEDILKYYSYDDEKWAYQNICDFLEEVLNTNRYDVPQNIGSYKINIIDILRPILKRIVIKLKINDKKMFFLTKKIKDKLKLFWEMREKYDKDIASAEEIEFIMQKIKQVVK
jgi:surface carbohydrate biosynthesis protein